MVSLTIMKSKDGRKGKEICSIFDKDSDVYTSEQGHKTAQSISDRVMKESTAINNGRSVEFIQKKSILINYWIVDEGNFGL